MCCNPQGTLKGVGNLASTSHFSNPCSFRDIENYKEVEDLNPVVGYCEGTLWFFFGFFQNFSEKLDIKNFTKLEISICVVRLSQGTLRS